MRLRREMRGIGWAFLVGALATAAADGQPELRVFVTNFAHVEDENFQAAIQVAQEIFRKADVPVHLLACTAVELDGVFSSKCPASIGGPNASVRVVALAAPAGKAMLLPMGQVMTDESGRRPDCVYIFYPRVSEFAEAIRVPAHRILGHAVAHEMGHLLGNDHALGGIMQARWGTRQVTAVNSGLLLFCPVEAVKMRNNIRIRVREALALK